jgi:hypothetical protein
LTLSIAFAGLGSAEQLREVTRPHVLAWRDHLQGRSLANDTIRRKLAALSSESREMLGEIVTIR